MNYQFLVKTAVGGENKRVEITFDLGPEAIIALAAVGNTNYEVYQVRVCASLRGPILIVGPVGAGKEALARTIHQWSRRPGELIVLNCATVHPDEILSTWRRHRLWF